MAVLPQFTASTETKSPNWSKTSPLTNSAGMVLMIVRYPAVSVAWMSVRDTSTTAKGDQYLQSSQCLAPSAYYALSCVCQQLRTNTYRVLAACIICLHLKKQRAAKQLNTTKTTWHEVYIVVKTFEIIVIVINGSAKRFFRTQPILVGRPK